MIEVDFNEKEKVENLYEEIKNLIVSKENNPSYKYNKKQHHLYEESEHPGISKNFYNESGYVEFKNAEGFDIVLKINRMHAHKHNGWSGLNSIPCLDAGIYLNLGEKLDPIWELKVGSGTLYYKAEVTNLEIPRNVLIEKSEEKEEKEELHEEVHEEINEQIEEKKVVNHEVLFKIQENYTNTLSTVTEAKEIILKKRQKEIDEAKEKIMKSYEELLKECDYAIKDAQNEVDSYDTLVEKYSTFDAKLIINALEQLMSIVENEEFLYKQVIHKYKKRVHGPIDSWDEDAKKNTRVIVRKSHVNETLKNTDDTTNIDNLVNNGDAIILSREDGTNEKNTITFYTSFKGEISSHANFGSLNYVSDFIDKLIQYRFKYDLKNFTEENMNNFIKTYMKELKEMIIKNFASKLDTKILNITL